MMPSVKATKAFSGAALLALLLSASSAWPQAAAPASQVDIRDLAFLPNVLRVKAGIEVNFVNHDPVLHSVIARDGQFDSGALEKDEAFSFTFTTPGEVSYICGVHARMTGKIIVEP